jgi:Zn-dependent alcohol dehydrogenase
MTAVTADVFPDLGTVISLAPATVETAAVLGIAAVGLAPLLGARRLRHLDIPSTLRVAEETCVRCTRRVDANRGRIVKTI